ncbi:MAG TPA: beta-propeller fold lactonase family protein [Candidatus Sulfotelmatobacter sp.]
MRSFSSHVASPFLLTLTLVYVARAATPVVHVTSPANGSSVTGPVNYVAAASAPGCKQGVKAIRIYSAPSVEAFTGSGDRINTYINLNPGTYNTVVQAWDNCGNVGKTNVTITVTSVAQPAGFVYTVGFDMNNLQSTTIQGFTIVPGNGALAKTLQGPVTANVDPVALAPDKGGYRLYVADYVSGDVFAYFIDRQNGHLDPVPGAPFAANRSVAAVAVHPRGKLIFAALSEYAPGDGVAVFQLQDDGSLKLAPGSPYATQTGPQGLTMDPDGNYLYVADGSGYIDAFQIDTVSAALTPLPGSPYPTPVVAACGNTYPRDVFDLNGKYLYNADGTAGVADGFAIEPTTGTLTALSGSPWEDTHCEGGSGIDYVQAWMSPRSLAVEGTGKFLYALNEFEDNIAIYSIASNGALKFKKFTPANSACYGAVRTDSTGNYLYAGGCTLSYTNPGYNLLVGFSINHTTGDLTPLPTRRTRSRKAADPKCRISP